MIRRLQAVEELSSFAEEFLAAGEHIHGVDTAEQVQANLLQCLGRMDDFVLGCYGKEGLESVFSVLVEKGEGYLELLTALTHSREHTLQVLNYLKEQYPGFRLDCVLHPHQRCVREALETAGAQLYPVQLTLRREGPAPACADERVIPFSEEYREGYFALHATDCYWTAQRVLDAPRTFRVLLALEGDRVAGYIDYTLPHGENEVYDLFVRPDCRRRGLGTGLLAAALADNGPKAMALCVDEDATAAIDLCGKLGFRQVPGRESLTAQLTL